MFGFHMIQHFVSHKYILYFLSFNITLFHTINNEKHYIILNFIINHLLTRKSYIGIGAITQGCTSYIYFLG